MPFKSSGRCHLNLPVLYSAWIFWKFSEFTKIQNIQRPTSSPAGAGTAHWRAVRGACDGLRARNVTGTSPVPCGSGTWLMIYPNWGSVPAPWRAPPLSIPPLAARISEIKKILSDPPWARLVYQRLTPTLLDLISC